MRGVLPVVAVYAAALCASSFVGACAAVALVRRYRDPAQWVPRSRWNEGQS